MAHFHKGCCHFGLGDLAEAVAEARWTFASSARIGDSRMMCSSWLWARATRGDIPFDELRGCIPCRPDDVMSTVHALLAEGYWHSYHGRTAEALQVYERAAEMVRKSLCVNSHTILVMPMLASGLRLHADAVQDRDAKQAEQLRKRACRVAKWGTRLCWLFPAAYPLALREPALILSACGKTKKALKFADKSCAVAEAQKAKYEHAQSLLVRGKLAKQLGLPEADEQIRAAEAALEEIERPVREAATRPLVSSTPASQADSSRQKPGEPTQAAEPTAPVATRRSLVGPVVAVLVALAAPCCWATCWVGVLATSSASWEEPSRAICRSGRRRARTWAPPSGGSPAQSCCSWAGCWCAGAAAPRGRGGQEPPPAGPAAGARPHGLFVIGVLVLGLSMIPAALGIGWAACWAAFGAGPWATALSGLGGVLGLALPFVMWRAIASYGKTTPWPTLPPV